MSLLATFVPCSQIAANDPLHNKTFKEILAQYRLVGDFGQKEEMRPLGDELFWRYKVSIPKVEFSIDYEHGPDKDAAMARNYPATLGQGRPLHHLNRGRKLFFEGNLEEARSTWLSARARYGNNWDFHRRNDYFLGNVFLHIGMHLHVDQGRPWRDESTKQAMENSASFLSWAFQMKKDVKDEFLDLVTPRALYNLAVVYYIFDRYPPSYGAAIDGLNFLRKTGRSDYRLLLRRVLAESYIKNRSYLEAVQELDTTLRQDANKAEAAEILARIGDIYFDLNNFELAEDAYALANRIDQEAENINPSFYALRGESLFWLGRFSDAQRMFHIALNTAAHKNTKVPLNDDLMALSSLRIADSWLAKKKFEEAKLAYFKHVGEFRGHPTVAFAKTRLACLELPEYDGNNITHARSELITLKEEITNRTAKELAWACEVASYAKHERTEAMLEHVREFAKLYPESRFLASLKEPVRDFQAAKILKYFEKGDFFGATAFFEANRERLFKELNEDLRSKLFRAYVATNRSAMAVEFWDSFAKNASSVDDRMIQAVVAAEEIKLSPKWKQRNQDIAAALAATPANADADSKAEAYLRRILSSDAAPIHLSWIYKFTKAWAKDDVNKVCQISYPLLSRRLREQDPPNIEELKAEASSLTDSYLNEILKNDLFCAYSLLGLEQELFKDQPRLLAARYLSREYLPIDANTARYFWTVAESLKEIGDEAAAKQLWSVITSKGSDDIPEVRYSRSRLNNKALELDDLWRR